MKLKLCVIRIFAAILILTLEVPPVFRAQETAPSGGQAIPELVQTLTVELQKQGVWRVLILDLEDPDKKITPFGVWLADQLAASIGVPLEVVDRKSIRSNLDRLRVPGKNEFDAEAAEALAKTFNATLVTGSYSGADNGLGVSLRAGLRPSLKQINAKLLATDEIKSHLGVPVDSLVPSDGVLNAGEGGVSLPECQHCPYAYYPPGVAKRGIQGHVLLQAIISEKGRTQKVLVEKKLDPQLDSEAVNDVKTWKFKPAVNLDGKAVPVRVPIEVSFRLY